jgi:phosphate-selective porin OprO/OprP
VPTILRSSALAIVVASGWAMPAHAQDTESAAAVQRELAAMRAQMAQMAQRIDTLEGQLVDARSRAEAATSVAAGAKTAAEAARASVTAKPETQVSWEGAPKLATKDGWSFKPRGRLQFDAGTVSAPSSIADKGLGFANEIRRARLGVQGTMPGGFGYRLEADFAGGGAEITDAYLTYRDGELTITAGQHNDFQGLEELSSSLHTSFLERASFTDAFAFTRRMGLSAEYAKGDVLVQAGVFTDNNGALSSDENNVYGFDGRFVYMPKWGETQLHFGTSLHYRELGDAVTTVRYRQRPYLRTTDTRFLDTGSIAAETESGLGLEAAAIRGPWHVAAETYWQRVGRPGAANPTFFGGYGEVGYFLTKGDTRGYKAGMFDRVKLKQGVDKGGIGAIQFNLRYEYLDLVDAGITGGKQDAYMASLIWTPTAHTRLMASYARLQYDMSRVATADGDRSYGVDTFGMRAQTDF